MRTLPGQKRITSNNSGVSATHVDAGVTLGIHALKTTSVSIVAIMAIGRLIASSGTQLQKRKAARHELL